MSVSTDLSPDFAALRLLGLGCPSSGDQTRTNCCCSWLSSSCIPGISLCYIRLCVGGEELLQEKPSTWNIYNTPEELGLCVPCRAHSGPAFGGCTRVTPRKTQCLWFVFLGNCGFLPTPAFLGSLCRQSAASPNPGGAAPRSQRGSATGEILAEAAVGKELIWGCFQAVLCSCRWGTPWNFSPDELSVWCASPS